MLFAVFADRGAPGATTAALAVASARGRPALVVEADPYGGDLALRLRPDGKRPMPKTPTVLGLAAGRSSSASSTPGSTGGSVWTNGSHVLSDLVRVVPGFMSAEQGGPLQWPALGATLANQGVPVFADVGRIHRGSPSMPVLTAADALIPVCRGDVGSVQHMLKRLEYLVPTVAEKAHRTPTVVPVVVAPRQRGEEMAKAVSELLAVSRVGPTVPFVTWLAWDPAGCTLLEHGEDPWAKGLRKSPLMKSARNCVRRLGLATGLDHAEPHAGPSQRRMPLGRKSSSKEGPGPEVLASGASERDAHRAKGAASDVWGGSRNGVVGGSDRRGGGGR